MLSQKNFELLDVVARLGSFSAAAEHLHKVPSAISYSVRQIEQELDVILFRRLPRRVELTPAGEIFIEQVRSMLRQIEEAKAQAKRTAQGWQQTLRITLDNIVRLDNLQHLIDDFYRQFDFAELQINMEVFNGAWEAIAQERADIVLGATSAIPVSGDFGIKGMGKMEWVFVCASDHPLANKSQLQVEDIALYPSVSLDDTSRVLPKRHQTLFTNQRRLLTPNWHTAIRCIKGGVGVGFVPEHIAHSLVNEKTLVTRDIEFQAPPSECCMVWRKDSSNKLIEWMLNYLGDEDKLHRDWVSSE
ncbi:DNA-binding transcriptional activator PunR [Vibrio ezurae]|uniref:Putative LysR family transcriptional regulator n=1 Tax=Vibrio ezurae NBRC 102218 TaxID=1219080 RepID=U3B6R3_9VIBR|nr:DNA-binding transcriptional activator PunR [Vibrio ezurae]GAD81117.1 putative LysR family transcriptional regulator [Vibrio ezurae NBRC 102218]